MNNWPPSSGCLGGLLRDVRKIQKKHLVYRHSGNIPDYDIPDPAVDVEFVSGPLINRIITPEKRRKKFHRFLDEGKRGFIAHVGGTVIARGWVSPPASPSVPNMNVPSWIADLDAYWLHHGYTKEQYRNRGWHEHMVARRLQWIKEQDHDGPVYADVAPENVSRHTMMSTNFEPCGLMTTYRIGAPRVGLKQFGNWDPEANHPPMPNISDT